MECSTFSVTKETDSMSSFQQTPQLLELIYQAIKNGIEIVFDSTTEETYTF